MSMKFDLPPYLYLCNNENYKKKTHVLLMCLFQMHVGAGYW